MTRHPAEDEVRRRDHFTFELTDASLVNFDVTSVTESQERHDEEEADAGNIENDDEKRRHK